MSHLRSQEVIDPHTTLGANIIADGRVRFRVWAPRHDQVLVDLVDNDRRVEMKRDASGYHTAAVDGVWAGTRYAYRLSGGPPRPDPVSRFQPDGVHGPSQVIDTEFAWKDGEWRPPAREDLIVYEAHVGAFTEDGTFASAMDRLDELVDLGVTAIEWMPIAQCPGKWNWGYDGVNWFAPNCNYGTPNDLRRFVDAAHQKGLAVIVDVVYNHFGPEGNYLGEFGPYLSSRHTTPWGAAPNLDDPPAALDVRQFVIANAVYWLDEFHIDGLRVDAIHCMKDDSESHIAAEITDAVRGWSLRSGRGALLIAESNVYDPEMLKPRDEGGIGFDAQWCDDLLHSVSAVVRPKDQLCHRAYQAGVDLDQTLRMGYVYEGTLREQRGRRPLGDRVDTSGLVYSIQQHDFVGNHPEGRRFHQLTSVDAQRAAAVLNFLSPSIPMIFMGEEFASGHPFRFFVDFGDPKLRQAVSEGRKREYPQHDWDAGLLPTDPKTFQASKIGPRDAGDVDLWEWYGGLIQLRKRLVSAGILDAAHLTIETDTRQGLYVLRYGSAAETILVAARLHPRGEGHPIVFSVGVESPEVLMDSRSESPSSEILFANHAKVLRIDGAPPADSISRGACDERHHVVE